MQKTYQAHIDMIQYEAGIPLIQFKPLHQFNQFKIQFKICDLQVPT